MLEEKEKNAKRIKEDKLVDLVIENAKIDIPEAMIKTQTRQILDEFGQRMQHQGITIEQYYQFTGTNEAQLLEQMNHKLLSEFKPDSFWRKLLRWKILRYQKKNLLQN